LGSAFLTQEVNRKSSTDVIYSDTTVVGGIEKNGVLPSGRKTHDAALVVQMQQSFLNNAYPGHDIIKLSTKGNNEKLTKILCYT
jgi:hypothetical protein